MLILQLLSDPGLGHCNRIIRYSRTEYAKMKQSIILVPDCRKIIAYLTNQKVYNFLIYSVHKPPQELIQLLENNLDFKEIKEWVIDTKLDCSDLLYLLKKRKIESCVIDMHTIKPIDKDALKKINKNYKLLVTIEEHSLMGGLGSAVAEYISSLEKSIPVLSIGIPDFYEIAGSYAELLSKYMLNPQQITDKIVQRYTSLYS